MKNNRISEDHFIFGRNYLPALTVTAFKCENTKHSFGSMNC